MPISIVLYIGESFAEAGIVASGKVTSSRRWYLGKESLSKGLASFLSQNKAEVSDVVVASKALTAALRKRLGSATAFLVTSGFENWLEMNRPIRQNHFTVAADRAGSILDSNLVFGVSERIGADGKVEKPLELPDLEFLAAKLKLNNIENVAIGFINSHLNSEHEVSAATFLRENGFKVTASSELSKDGFEVARWWTAVTSAYLSSRHADACKEISTALEEVGYGTSPIRFLTPNGLLEATDPRTPVGSLFGPLTALNKRRQVLGTQALVYLGVEDFWVLDGRWQSVPQWRADFGPLAISHPGFQRIDLHATQIIHKSFWGNAGFDKIEGGFEPGPMCLGKGLFPQLLDILWLQGRLGDVEGISDRLVERARPRVEESLAAQLRTAFSDQNIQTKTILDELEAAAAQRIAWQIPVGNEDAVICGSLAKALQPALAKVFKSCGREVNWQIETSAMMEALAPLTLGAQEDPN